jgi:FtsP/CotA-like multicopper oxidase with cupredoxin domain
MIIGKYNGGGSLYQKTFEAGKKYLIRIINGSTGLHFHFSLDEHIMTVVSMDMVPIKPYNTTSLSVGIGQRYGVIIEAKPTTKSSNGKYWMRTEYTALNNCNAESQAFPPQTSTFNERELSAIAMPAAAIQRQAVNLSQSAAPTRRCPI